MQYKRWIIVIGISAAVILAVIYGFLPKPVSVEAVKAARGMLRVTIEEEGKTRVSDRFTVYSPVSGFMRRIPIQEGDRIEKDQTLAEFEPSKSNPLDPRSYAAAKAGVASAEASLKAETEKARAAEVEAQYSLKNFERMQKLFKAGLISRDSFEQAEAVLKSSRAASLSAEAGAKAARSELDRAQAALLDGMGAGGKTVSIKAPVAGSVLKIYRESEGIIQAGDPLIDIGDPQKLEVRVEVLSTDAVQIRPGTPVIFERWGGESVLSGTVRIVEPMGFTKISSLGVEEQRVPVIVDFTNADMDQVRLGDGYRLEASFTIWEGQEVLQVPASALFRNQGGWAVFVVQNGRALKRDVKVGHRTGLAAEILAGLAEGERVVSYPDNTIEDGSRVSVR